MSNTQATSQLPVCDVAKIQDKTSKGTLKPLENLDSICIFFFFTPAMPGDSVRPLKTGERSLVSVLEHGVIRRGGERVKRRESIGGVETVIISAPQIKNDTHKQSRRCSQTQTAHFLQAQTPVRRSHSSSSKSDNRKPRKHGRHPWLRSSTRDLMSVLFYSARKALFACGISRLM